MGVKYNRTLSPLKGIYTQKPDSSKLEYPTQLKMTKFEKKYYFINKSK